MQYFIHKPGVGWLPCSRLAFRQLQQAIDFDPASLENVRLAEIKHRSPKDAKPKAVWVFYNAGTGWAEVRTTAIPTDGLRPLYSTTMTGDWLTRCYVKAEELGMIVIEEIEL